MKIRQICTIYRLLLCCFVSIILYLTMKSVVALAENAASDRILIYNQNSGNAAGGSNDGQQTCRNLALRGSNTMGSSGCGIYAMAHAYQWLTGDKRTTNNAAELLQMFINNNINEGSNAPWDGLLDIKYGSILVYKYNAEKVCWPAENRLYPVTEADWLSLTQNGGVAILNIYVPDYISGYDENGNPIYYSGHYNCAVGAVMADIDGNGNTELWIHIVDSSAASTFHRLYKKGQYPAYSFSNHSLISTSTGNGYWRGDEYWVSYSVLRNSMTVVGAYVSGSHNKQPEKPKLSISPADGGHSTQFSWNATKYTTYYDIHIRDKNNNVVLDDTTGKDTSYVTQLPVGSYYAYVGAVNTNADEWKSTDSDYIWFNVVNHNAIPGKPNLQVVPADNKHETYFSWEETINTDHYDIHIMDSNDESVLDVCVGLNCSYSAKLRAGSYKACVGAVNEYTDDTSKWTNSDIVSFIVPNANPRPGKPVLTVDAKDDTQDTVFTWTDTENTTYYDVHLYTEEGSLISTDGVGRETVFRKRLPAGVYRAYIGAVNSGEDDWTWTDSDWVRFHVIEYGATPEKPVLNVNTSSDSNNVEFMWEETANTWRYDLHVCDSDGNMFMEKSFYAPTTYSATLPDGSYYAYVGAVNEYAEPWTWNDSERVYFQPGVRFEQPDFILPSMLTTVNESAFEGIAASVVYVPDTCFHIGKWAFRNCLNLTQIRIPAGCTIDTDAFTGCNDVVIFGTKGSAAEAYANNHANCTFVAE